MPEYTGFTLMPGFSFSNFATSSAGEFCGLSKWYHQRTVACCARAGEAKGAASAPAPASFRNVLRFIGILPLGSWFDGEG